MHDFFVAVCSLNFNRLEIYERQAGSANWSSVKSIPMPANGTRVALHGETLVFTSENETVNGRTNAGAAYVFDRNFGGSGAWGQVTRLTRGPSGARFGGSAEEATLFGDNADADGDGIVTPFEALFGLDPNVPDASLAPIEGGFDPATRELTLIYHEASQLLGVAPRPEWSPDLTHWYLSGDGPAAWEIRRIRIEPIGQSEAARFKKAARLEALPGDDQRTALFLRLGVTKQ